MGGELPRLGHEIVGKIVIWRVLWLPAFFTCQQHLGFTSDCNKEFALDFCVFCYVSDNKREEHSCVCTLTASPSRHEEAPWPYCSVRVESNHVELVLCSGKAEDLSVPLPAAYSSQGHRGAGVYTSRHQARGRNLGHPSITGLAHHPVGILQRTFICAKSSQDLSGRTRNGPTLGAEPRRTVGVQSDGAPEELWKPGSFRPRCFSCCQNVQCSISVHTWKTFLSH